jgi:riboflavin synthase
MLEAHVAFVNGLKARTARKRGESQEEREVAEPHSVSVSTLKVGMQLGSSSARILLELDGRATHRYIGMMFTGLVATTGVLVTRGARGPGARLTLRAHLDGDPLVVGESIAVDGCCLTVAATAGDGFVADVSAETLARTTLGDIPIGADVNLERALRAGDRLGGHFLAGHIDGVGELVGREAFGESEAMTFACPAEIDRFVAEKGSVAVNGVSLTVNRVAATHVLRRSRAHTFDVMLIPTTLATTNLARLAPGSRVNLEVDLIARYVARLMDVGQARSPTRDS